ncbi:MAG: hypothetical protein ACLQOO_19025 [Terriglobia bacterium]
MYKHLWEGLKRFWEAWKVVARKIGNFQARVLLTIIYAVLVLPFGVCVRLFSDQLRIKHPPAKWLDHPNETADMEWARKQ